MSLDEELRGRLRALADRELSAVDDAVDDVTDDALIAAIVSEASVAPDGEGLDEDLQRRLGVLADAELAEQSEASVQELAVAIGVEHGSRLRRRRRLRVGVPVALAAAAAAFLAVWGARRAEPSRAPEAAVTPAEPSVVEAPSRCSAFAPLETRTVTAESARTIALGTRGEARLAPGSVLRVRGRSRCETQLDLSAGTVTVHARDLGGGSLAVVAGDVSAHVRGTRFTVARSPGGVTVDVFEGHVEVVQRGASSSILGGQRWTSSEPTAEAQRGETPSDITPTAPGVDGPADVRPRPRPQRSRELTTEGERAWRRGERARARALLREAGRAPGVAGEAAWIRLARLELSGGSPRRSLQALDARRRHFPRGGLQPLALWIEAQAADASGDPGRARRVSRRLARRFPRSTEAQLARERFELE